MLPKTKKQKRSEIFNYLCSESLLRFIHIALYLFIYFYFWIRKIYKKRKKEIRSKRKSTRNLHVEVELLNPQNRNSVDKNECLVGTQIDWALIMVARTRQTLEPPSRRLENIPGNIMSLFLDPPSFHSLLSAFHSIHRSLQKILKRIRTICAGV